MILKKNSSRNKKTESEYIKRLFGEQTGRFRKPYFTTEDLIALTGWSKRTIQKLRSNKEVSFIKHNRKILYPRDKVFEFLQAHLVD